MLPIVENDTYLTPYSVFLEGANSYYQSVLNTIKGNFKSIGDAINGHLYFGLHKTEENWIFREWAPNATSIFLVGDFNQWKKSKSYEFSINTDGNWELILPLENLSHGDLYKLIIVWADGEGERIPAWAYHVVQDNDTKQFAAQVWNPDKPYLFKHKTPKKPTHPLIYEAHIGMASEEGRVATYEEFRKNILPKISALGYNTVQLMAIQEHPYYGSFGYHVSSFFAASSRFGTPDELKKLIDDAHKLGLYVIMDIVHSHAVKNELEGLSKYNGTTYQFFHDGFRGTHPAWDSRCFDYSKIEVLHFLLSNCKFWLHEFHFDGFRFDGVTSMIYKDHGLGRDFMEYKDYFNDNLDLDAIAYLRTANILIHELNPQAITIAEEMSGLAGMASAISYGGIGFDYRLAMGIPDFWIKTIKEVKDEEWHVGDFFHRLTDKRNDEHVISYVESHDQALVGDKTMIFRLIDSEMYYSMRIDQPNLLVDRGIALHKIFRLITIATAQDGYLNFMGNEFGHPEWIDFPRLDNNWSYHYARRQWSLSTNPELKYQYLQNFDKAMISCIKNFKILDYHPEPIVRNIPDQVLAFKRGEHLFVFNFNPNKSFQEYGIQGLKGKWKIVLNTDHPDFGGFNRINETMDYLVTHVGGIDLLRLYIPSRTAIVFQKID